MSRYHTNSPNAGALTASLLKNFDEMDGVDSGEIVTLNIGGRRFMIWRRLLSRIPGSRLENSEQLKYHYNQALKEYFFARSPQIFESIYDLYATGELHFKSNFCGGEIKRELRFWGIGDEYISGCCQQVLTRYTDAIARTNNLANMFNSGLHSTSKQSDIRQKLWYFLERPKGRIGLMYRVPRLVLTLLSVALYCVSSTELFREPDTESSYYTNNISYRTDAAFEPNPKIFMYKTTRQKSFMNYLDYTCTMFFTMEFVLRFVVSTNKREFMTAVLNVTDFLCLVADWFIYLKKLVTIHLPYGEYVWGWIYSMKILRVFRLFKSNSKYSGLRIVVLAMKASIAELLLMSMILLLGVTAFSILIYNAEFNAVDRFFDIPSSGWWVIISMTTVGYGDVYPSTTAGKVVGGFCATTGILFLSLLIPIIAANFTEYYNYALRNKKEEESNALIRKQQKKKSNELKNLFAQLR